MKLNTNISSLTTQRHLAESSRSSTISSGRLASGSRINTAADDAAGLSISTKLNATNRSRQAASRNALDGISILQISSGGMETIHGQLTRLRELSIQAANGTYHDEERQLLNLEVQQIKTEINRIGQATKYNNQSLLTGSNNQFDIVVDKGSGSNDIIKIQFDKMAQDTHALGIFDIAVNTQLRAQLSLEKIDYAIEEVSKSRAEIGANQNRLQAAINNLEVSVENTTQAHSRIKDTDYAEETANLTKEKIKTNSSTSVLVQANNLGRNALRLLE
jgi:flagellin